MEITVKQKNVHSKKLFAIVDEHVRAIIMLLDLASDIDGVIGLINMTLAEEAEQHKLEQINIIGDSRNNKLSDIMKGKFVIDIYYRHKNCFNTTQLSYIIQK